MHLPAAARFFAPLYESSNFLLLICQISPLGYPLVVVLAVAYPLPVMAVECLEAVVAVVVLEALLLDVSARYPAI